MSAKSLANPNVSGHCHFWLAQWLNVLTIVRPLGFFHRKTSPWKCLEDRDNLVWENRRFTQIHSHCGCLLLLNILLVISGAVAVCEQRHLPHTGSLLWFPFANLLWTFSPSTLKHELWPISLSVGKIRRFLFFFLVSRILSCSLPVPPWKKAGHEGMPSSQKLEVVDILSLPCFPYTHSLSHSLASHPAVLLLLLDSSICAKSSYHFISIIVHLPLKAGRWILLSYAPHCPAQHLTQRSLVGSSCQSYCTQH